PPPEELRAKAREAEAVLTCTQEASAYLRELVGNATPVHRIYHGVDLPRTAPTDRKLNAPVVLAIGRRVEKKGLETLIRAAALLQRRGIDFKVRIGGEGPEWARLQRLAHELGVAERIAFLGPLMEDEVVNEYGRASIFALPCRVLPNGDRDGVPNVIVEAMANGLPVVSTTLSSVREAVVDGCLMRLRYVSADPGVPVFGHKGASVHVREIVTALSAEGARVAIASPRICPEGDGIEVSVDLVELPPVIACDHVGEASLHAA